MSKPIYPDYKGNYKGKLPILRHTKVRRPRSSYEVKLSSTYASARLFNKRNFIPMEVQDIKTGLPDPINLVPPFIPFENDIMGDWNDKYIAKQFNDSMAELFGVDPNPPKPSLLTKLKNRFKK